MIKASTLFLASILAMAALPETASANPARRYGCQQNIRSVNLCVGDRVVNISTGAVGVLEYFHLLRPNDYNQAAVTYYRDSGNLSNSYVNIISMHMLDHATRSDFLNHAGTPNPLVPVAPFAGAIAFTCRIATPYLSFVGYGVTRVAALRSLQNDCINRGAYFEHAACMQGRWPGRPTCNRSF